MKEQKKYLIAIPCLDMMPVGFTASLISVRRVGASKVSFLANSLVYDARNMLTAEALDTGADRVLFIDSDMVFKPDLMERLAADMDERDLDYVCGIFVKRRLPTIPCVYKTLVLEDGKGRTEIYADYPQDSIFQVAGSGFGAVMVSTALLKDVYDTYGPPFLPYPGVLGEDLSFCWRARQLGYELYCDSRIKVGHMGTFVYGEEHYRR